MRKQKTQMFVMLLIIVVLTVCYLGIRSYNSAKEADEENAEQTVMVTDLDVSDITSFSYTLDGITYAYTKQGEEWQWDGDTTMDLDESQVESLVSSAAQIAATETITEYENLTDYGLDNVSLKITLTTADKTVCIEAGDKNAVTGEYYVKCENDETVYLTNSNLTSIFSKLPEDMMAEEETETEEVNEESIETEETNAAEQLSDTETE